MPLSLGMRPSSRMPRAPSRAPRTPPFERQWRVILPVAPDPTTEATADEVVEGIPMAELKSPPSRPEDDHAVGYEWFPVSLGDPSAIISLQKNGWSVGGMVPPRHLHVWLRRPR